MKITRSREHTVNMGGYESLRIGTSVESDELELTDMTSDKEPHPRVFSKMDAILSKALENELNEAKALTNKEDSYIYSWRINSTEGA